MPATTKAMSTFAASTCSATSRPARRSSPAERCERGPAGEDGLDDDGRAVLGGCRRDPVTDRGQVARAERLVPEPAETIAAASSGCDGTGDDPGIAMGRHDAGRTEPGRVVRQEGGRPAGIPAELGEPVRGGVDGVARHHPTRLSLPVRFA
jgi:hypothetical protein